MITGASAGFGEACARRYRGPEFRLILSARRYERLEMLQKELAETECYAMLLDVRDRNGVGGAIANLPDPFCEIDILINNAGLALGLEPAQEADLDNWDTMVDTNVRASCIARGRFCPGWCSGAGDI